MSKTQTKSTTDAPAHKPTMAESIRETVDSVVIAFVLAFLFRTFEAEAFVIPTGSMALTLMGDHKDLVCSQCQYPYRVSASDESPNSPGEQIEYNRDPDEWQRAHTVTSGVCPNCRYRMQFDDSKPENEAHPPDVPMQKSYKGDRILVTKYSYEFSDPQRWDVAVFKNPSQAKINYIKRVVGLPNEEVLIHRGDIYTAPLSGEGPKKYRPARKPHAKAIAMAQVVYDHDYVLPHLHELGWPQRWISEKAGNDELWRQSADMKSFDTDGRGGDEAWLRYQHYVPSDLDWDQMKEGKALDPAHRARLRPQLVTDFCEYNTERTREVAHALERNPAGATPAVSAFGLHWCADLLLECEVEFGAKVGDDAAVVLELVEGGRAFQCRLEPKSGTASLSISDLAAYHPTAKGVLSGTGKHRLRFANVDDQLLLWVDETPITFDGSTHYQSSAQLRSVNRNGVEQTADIEGEEGLPALDNVVPKAQDLASPAGIGVRGADVRVAHLRLLRDTYYIADSERERHSWFPLEEMKQAPINDYEANVFAEFAKARDQTRPHVGWTEQLLREFMSDVDTLPERWRALGFVTFPMGPDQFFVLGDNSPRSLDGRLWDDGIDRGGPAPFKEWFVKRELLIGKALFVYWPHALDHVPGTGIPFPLFPNFGRMRMIR
jgi:signal peptidase I